MTFFSNLDQAPKDFILMRLKDFFFNANSIYLPVHILYFIRRLVVARDTKSIILYKTLKGWVKSVSFATFYAISVALAGTCYPKYILRGRPANTINMLPIAPPFAAFILLESSSRWGEMSIWVFANWIESILTFFKKMKIGIDIPHFEV